MIDLSALSAPFPPDKISWRVGSTNKDKTKGMALAYIDARDVMDRLDEVCGPAGWQCSYPHANGKTVCSIGIKIGDEWVWKANGAGDTDIEAEKGALSDAFKRAAVCWGIGRYLYDMDSPWVAIEPMGRSYKIADHEKARLLRWTAAPVPTPEKMPPPRVVTGKTVDNLPPPEEPTESEKRIAEGLKTAIGLASSPTDLEKWKRDPDNVKLFGMLPTPLRVEVQAFATKHLKSLQEHEPVLMAG
jgi:hypothetical protein